MTPRAVRLMYLLLIVAFACSGPTLAPAHAQYKSGGSQVTTDLKTMLEKGLPCRLPREFAFVAKVVTYVEDGRLDRKTVMVTFEWARHQKDEFQGTYFILAMRKQAEKLGVTGL